MDRHCDANLHTYLISMAKQAYFVLLLLVASYCVWKVEAGEVVDESYAWITRSRKFLGNNGSLLRMMGIDTDSESNKGKCVRYRKPCKGPDDCCKSCYCKAFGSPTSFVTLCDGKTDCH